LKSHFFKIALIEIAIPNGPCEKGKKREKRKGKKEKGADVVRVGERKGKKRKKKRKRKKERERERERERDIFGWSKKRGEKGKEDRGAMCHLVAG